MLTKLSLRLRVFLFFLLLAVAGITIVMVALYLGFARMQPGEPGAAFVLSAVMAGFGLLAVTAGIWLLFDENVARPIERLAATMRTRAHAGVDVTVDEDHARYLGDLAPAAQAVSGQLSQSAMDAAEAVANETAHLSAEKERLTALLTEIPMAVVLLNPAHQIVLYDAQAADVLGQIHVPRLNASIFDYFRRDGLLAALKDLERAETEVRFKAEGSEGNLSFDVRIKPLAHAPGYMLLIDDVHTLIPPDAARPLIYDFALMEKVSEHAIEDRPVAALDFVVFDTETTGLMPHKDEIVQIGAVRVVNGKIVPGEQMDQLVNPGMPIPPASTRVHKVTNEMVADAPGIAAAAHMFHRFAQGAVIVAHNAPFDMAFLRRHGKKSGLDWNHPILDTVLLSAVLFGASETHTLDALCNRLGITIPEDLRHTALGDAYATAEALCRMLPMLTSRRFNTFAEVIEQTRKHGRLLEDLN
ncbi:MAG: DNA polymerase III subunit epsilon [Rhodobacterales bacterium]|nr:MAG: DNA polymerase III subunit epsilon [Rhodobacterales bacterium]